MHETQIAKNVLDVVLERAALAGANRVRRVIGWVAEDEALSREALLFHFQAHAKGTLAEGAELALELRLILARCSDCGKEYVPDHHVTLCPACGSLQAELQGKKGLEVESLEVE
jgi:hydrogenase nickel incorporation protein HypA/HybF